MLTPLHFIMLSAYIWSKSLSEGSRPLLPIG